MEVILSYFEIENEIMHIQKHPFDVPVDMDTFQILQFSKCIRITVQILLNLVKKKCRWIHTWLQQKWKYMYLDTFRYGHYSLHLWYQHNSSHEFLEFESMYMYFVKY